jgi:hypothetical protein
MHEGQTRAACSPPKALDMVTIRMWRHKHFIINIFWRYSKQHDQWHGMVKPCHASRSESALDFSGEPSGGGGEGREEGPGVTGLTENSLSCPLLPNMSSVAMVTVSQVHTLHSCG